ncbi:MAG: hypothetical protein WKF89_01930 [Chitinophagaceae bacterium]
MIPSNIKRADTLRTEIDKALISLADPDKQHDEPFDFHLKFEALLSITGIKKSMHNEISRYYSVMKDLFGFAGYFLPQLIEIKEPENLNDGNVSDEIDVETETIEVENVELIYKYYWELYDIYRKPILSFSRIDSHLMFSNRYQDQKDTYQLLLKPHGIRSEITKYRYLLNRDDQSKYRISDFMQDNELLKKISILFVKYGYNESNEINPGLTLEKYVSSISTNPVEKHIMEETKKIEVTEVTEKEEFPHLQLKSLSNRIVLLEQLGIIDHLQAKYKLTNAPGKTASIIALILGLNENETKSCKPTVSKLLNNSEGNPKNPRSINAIAIELKKIGIG